MGGLCGIISEQPCAVDLFYGTDYNSHLGTKRAGLATYEKDCGFFRGIHNLENASIESRLKVVHETHDLAMALHAELIKNIQRGLEER